MRHQMQEAATRAGNAAASTSNLLGSQAFSPGFTGRVALARARVLPWKWKEVLRITCLEIKTELLAVAKELEL